jgi:DNA polymerase-3 subunit gamma/tau
MAYQSLYRRYRPRRFSDVKGQPHVVMALHNAVREGRVGHAYLFSGPRGTGKTSTARILAKVLNCAAPVDGEPCCECENCLAVENGVIVDWLQELDAATNNRVEQMRDLLDKVPLGTSGNRKVYILDEVHMLTGGAANALLKTLEEPPDHVVFVLATTDPHKVLPTIRSRTQHFDFHLVPVDELDEHVRWVIQDAGLAVGDDGIEHVLRVGGGSVRDALSALDQVAAAGGVLDRRDAADELLDALVARDPGRTLGSVADAVNAGRDPRVLVTSLIGRLRDVFLASLKAGLDHLSDIDRDRATQLAEQVERPFLTRSLEVLGEASVDMREAPDPRITLEVALVRLTNVDADASPAALLERIERLERALATGTPAATTPTATTPAPAAAARDQLASRSAPALGGIRSTPQPEPAQPQAQPEPEAPTAPAAPTGPLPTRDELTLAWGDHVLASLRGSAAKARFAGGRFVAVEDGAAVFGLPNAVHRDRCEECRTDVEAALAAHFGRPVPLRLVVDTGPVAPPADSSSHLPEDDGPVDVHDLVDAPAETVTGVDRLTQAFPGAQLIEGDQPQ